MEGVGSQLTGITEPLINRSDLESLRLWRVWNSLMSATRSGTISLGFRYAKHTMRGMAFYIGISRTLDIFLFLILLTAVERTDLRSIFAVTRAIVS